MVSTVRVRLGVALAACGFAVACSLLTHLDEPTEGGAGDAALCTPEVIVDLGSDASITSLYVDEVGGRAYFVSSPLGNVYAVALDAGVNTTPTTVMTGLLSPERIAGADDKGNAYVFVAALGRGTDGGGIFVLPPDGGVQSVVDAAAPLHAFGLAAQGIFPPTLYWTSCTQSDCSSGGAVLATSLASGTTTTIAVVDSGPRDLVLTDQSAVWWVDQNAALNTIGDGGIRQYACAGVLAYLSSSQPRIAYTTTNPCSSAVDLIHSIATDDPNASPVVLDDNSSGLVDGPSSLAFDGSRYLYWANLTGKSIARRDVTTDAGDQQVAASAVTPRQIVWIPPGILYWTTDSGLVRCTL